MNTLERLETAQVKLAALYERQRAKLLPDEDRAFLSMLGKLAIMADFLRLPPEKVARLPASGEGSWIDGERMAAAMAADVEDLVENEEIAENVCLADDGQAAKMHLAAGRAIYYGEDRFPKEIIRELPDGRRHLVKVLGKGKIEVLREIDAKVRQVRNVNARFLDSIDVETKATILDGIAAHYRTTTKEALNKPLQNSAANWN